MPKFIVRYQRAFINYPETMILDVNFEDAEMKAALLTLVQRFHPTAKKVEEVLTYHDKKRNSRRAVYSRPTKLL
jgi:hypothetical protein